MLCKEPLFMLPRAHLLGVMIFLSDGFSTILKSPYISQIVGGRDNTHHHYKVHLFRASFKA